MRIQAEIGDMKTPPTAQTFGCLDVELRMQCLETKRDPLSRLDTVIDGEGFRPLLVQGLCRNGQGMRYSGCHHPTVHSDANLPPTQLGRSHSRTMKFTLTLLTALLLAPLVGLHAAEVPAKKPNIVLILADDLGYRDLGCYGATKIKTHRIAALAGEGVRFTDAPSVCGVCAPSRYSILTGTYQPLFPPPSGPATGSFNGLHR